MGRLAWQTALVRCGITIFHQSQMPPPGAALFQGNALERIVHRLAGQGRGARKNCEFGRESTVLALALAVAKGDGFQHGPAT